MRCRRPSDDGYNAANIRETVMSARTLRLLISMLVVGIIFIYVASLQLSDTLPVKTPDEGKPGAPLAGLNRRQLEKFYRCKDTFRKVFPVKEGLGPLFNEASCAQCHGGTESPGASATIESGRITMFAKRAAKSKLASLPLSEAKEKLQSQDMDYLINRGGPVLVKKSITEECADQLAELQILPSCKVKSMTKPPAEAELVANRLSRSLYGLGLLSAVADSDIGALVDMQKKSKSAVKGTWCVAPVEISGPSALGRFGSKAQDATLLALCAKELSVHLGITNPFAPQTISETGPDNQPPCIKDAGPPDPNVDSKLLAQLVYYITLLAPPKRPAELTNEQQQGEMVFKKLGCAECHVPLLKTSEKVYVLDPDSPAMLVDRNTLSDGRISYTVNNEPTYIEIRPLEKQNVEAYTDLLVHNMGKELADGIAQGGVSGAHWRTAPLWGCKDRSSYLHDGRAHTLDTAITMHGGEATESVNGFKKLPQNVKDSLFAFLKSL